LSWVANEGFGEFAKQIGLDFDDAHQFRQRYARGL